MALPTPEKPANAFDQGATDSVERQKQALTELLASQGNAGRQLLQNRGQDAGAIAAAAKAQYGDAGKPVSDLYDTFNRDAEQSKQFHDQEQARILAANKGYMDQVTSAIPLQRKDSDTYLEALRLQFEDRQRQAEEEAAQKAASAAAQKAATQSYYQKQTDKNTADTQLAKDKWAQTSKELRRPQDAELAGAAGGPRDIVAAATAIGMDPNAAKNRWVDRKAGQFREQDDQLMTTMTDTLQDAYEKNKSWGEVMTVTKAFAAQQGLNWEANIQPWLATYSPLWGMEDADWVTAPAKGPGFGYNPNAPISPASPAGKPAPKKLAPTGTMYKAPAAPAKPKAKTPVTSTIGQRELATKRDQNGNGVIGR